MEKAIYINHEPAELGQYGDATRVYFGEEFCSVRVPKLSDYELMMKRTLDSGKSFTLVLPYMPEGSIVKYRRILDLAAKVLPQCEITINDWGVYNMIKGNTVFTPILGRLLNKQKRDMRILNHLSSYNEDTLRHYSESHTDSIGSQKYLMARGIGRIEMDNIPLLKRKSEIPGSIYAPFIYVSMTRYCQTASCEAAHKFNTKNTTWVKPCKLECKKYSFSLKHARMPKTSYLYGNTIFFECGELPENLEEMNIDRVVIQTDFLHLQKAGLKSNGVVQELAVRPG